MQKNDFMQKREFGFGKLSKADVSLPRIAFGPQQPAQTAARWEPAPTAVRRTNPPAESMTASNPDPHQRAWPKFLESCLRFLGCD